MNDSIKKVKDYLNAKSQRFGGNMELTLHSCSIASIADMNKEDDLRQEMRFETYEDLDFDLMDFFFESRLSYLCWLGHDLAMNWNWDGVYDRLKWIVEDLVGWESIYTSEDKHPALHSKQAFRLVLEHLALACQEGDVEGRKRRRKEETHD